MNQKSVILEIKDTTTIAEVLNKHDYVAEEELTTALFLLLKLQKPLLVEGPPGVGKTEIAIVLSQLLHTSLIRLQCYEGIDANTAIYEWNYQKQLLSIKLQENSGLSVAEKEKIILSDDYLLKRPLLESISAEHKSPVLLIDEIDRSDEGFEAFLLELLSGYQITIPEIGTIVARHKPFVVLTSNRTRELSDALKRRCLYYWIEYPSYDKELAVIHKKLPNISHRLTEQVVQFVQQLRTKKIAKLPGVSETIDWVQSLTALGFTELTEEAFHQTAGCVLKTAEDIKFIKNQGVLLK
jgi:MoxR-like ATPase